MTFTTGDLLIGAGPEVYYYNGKRRRWVPDPTTLVLVDTRGWAAVKRVAQTDLDPIPVGRALPPTADGTLLIEPDGTAYVANGAKLHLVPDAETLATIPRDHVATLEPRDLRLLHDPIGSPLPSVGDADEQALAIDAYVRSLAPLPAEDDHDTPGPVVKRPGTVDVEGVAMEVEEQRVEMTRSVADFVEISPIPDVMWAGATITGASVRPGSLAPIALARHPGWITITTDLTTAPASSQSRRLDDPSLRTYVDTLAELIDDLKPTDSAAAASFRMEQISTLEEAMVSFGLNVKGAGWGVDAKAQLNTHLDRSTTFGMFSQAYYQVAFTPEGSPPRFFADGVTVDQVRSFAGPDNPPCYISSVTYGRMLTFLVDSAASSLEVKAALQGSWTSAVSGSGSAEAQHRETLQKSSVTALVVGGSSGAVGEVITNPAENLVSWIRGQLQISSALPATPIQYTVRYLAAPHNLVRVSRTTDPVRIVNADVYGGREASRRYSVGEGPGCGPVATGMRFNVGDELTVSATGSIWAGWILLGSNGPDGLDGPPKSWYPLPSGQGVHGSMLIGGWDNTDWFPIGSGKRLLVPDGRDDQELWLRLNDDDMTNGNGAFDVNVSVRRRVPVINAIPA
jgi:hypothetical protein